MNEFNKDINSRRYARHIVLPEIGATGQARLADASVLVIGAGGLGSASLSYLAAMGIGRIGIVDDDRVELSNLQRQTLFETADIGRLKVQAAKDRLQELNPDCRVDIFPEQFPHASIDVSRYDLVLDGSDNFATRFAVNDACVQSRITLISAAISGFQGQIFTVKPHGPCVRCFIPDLPEKALTCRQEGVIGALCGVMGSFQALEAVKELLGIGESLSGKILRYDALQAHWNTSTLLVEENCPYYYTHHRA